MEATGLLAVLRVSGGRWRRRGAEKEKEPSTEASVLGLEGKTETLRTSREFEESREREKERENSSTSQNRFSAATTKQPHLQWGEARVNGDGHPAMD